MPPSPFARSIRRLRAAAAGPLVSVGLAAAVTVLIVLPCQAKPAVTITGQAPGSVPFISILSVSVDNPAGLDEINFKIDSKPGSVVRPVSARYSAAYLRRRGYVDAKTGVVTVPVFGLYADYTNKVTVTTRFVSGASEVHQVQVPTAHFRDEIHKHPQIVQARTKDTSLSYDYLLLKDASSETTPLLLDTDGEIRWAGFAGNVGGNSIFYNNGFYVTNGAFILRAELDGGGDTLGDYADQGVLTFHHNIDVGRDGIIMDVNTAEQTESVNIEVDPATGAVLHTWNLADIISAAMKAGGDDPIKFVAPAPYDWFHNNATAYRPSDNTLIVSSRENFVVAVDYDTGELRWILGDPSKAWYQFASLRKYALTLVPGSHPPIGQHAVSIVRDRLLLFDDGYHSLLQQPPGKSRPYSAARKYVIDTVARPATETWTYSADRMISSPICSSVYEDEPKNFLIDFATEGYSPTTPAVSTEILGLNAAGAKVFDYKYRADNACDSGWNAQPIHLEHMSFD